MQSRKTGVEETKEELENEEKYAEKRKAGIIFGVKES
jgi:hypothetical protein